MGEKQLNIVMYPWLAMGHNTPYLHLANQLAEKGHKVTLLLPNKAKLKLQSLNLHPSLINFHIITVPHIPPLPLDTQTNSEIPFHLEHYLATAFDKTRPELESIITTLKPNLVIYDFAYWIPEVVASATTAFGSRAKCVTYCAVSAAALAFAMVPFRDPPKDRPVSREDLSRVPPGYPSSTVVMDPEKMFFGYSPFGEGVTFYERITTALKNSDAIAIKTCPELEGKYCDFLSTQYNKPVFLPGLVLPKPVEEDLSTRWADWLGQFRSGSVVFCVFGSQVVLEVAQFQELLLGFEMTKLPFLVAFKPPKGCATVEEAFPEGFGERVRERGVVTGEWVQQAQILAHPSVGCFVSHCGSGSIWECLLSGSEIVLMPHLPDQELFSKIITQELKAAVEVERGEDGSWVSKESFCKAIKSVMDEDSEIRSLVKKNHDILRQKLLVTGTSYFDNFINDLEALVG